MPLAAGQTLTHYEILGPLGAGGMGEVYRAKDTRLEREVAIKVLPEHFADDEERLRRFEREAKTLASLNHSNVAGIHGIDQVEGTCFLAMELVPGEDLEERLRRGALPVAEALDVCRQIAEGLEAAHEAGVVHRDLKPANVRVTPDGVAKVLDFGLAKPIHPRADKGGTTTAESDSFLVTEEGLVLGTPTYMSPEQARGKPVDRRTDIWAFGCVLYECLTGRRAFGGESLTDILAAIVEREPDWSALPARTPDAVRRLLLRCLTKDPRQRLRDVGEARVTLQSSELERDESVAGARPSRARTALVGAACLVAGVALTTLALEATRAGDERSPADGTSAAGVDVSTGAAARVRRFVEPTPVDALGREHLFIETSLSPDGRTLAAVTTGGLYLRSLDAAEPTALPIGTAAREIAWAPDSESLAYLDGRSIFRVPARGGAAVQLFTAPDDGSERFRLAWLDDGRILFVRKSAEGGLEVHAIPEDGGASSVVEAFESARAAMYVSGLTAIPGGRFLAVLFEVEGGDARQVLVGVDGSGMRRLLELDGLRTTCWVPGGRLLLQTRRTSKAQTWVVRLSPETLEVHGEPRLLEEELGGASVSADGTLAYVESNATWTSRLAWWSPDGTLEPFGREHDSITSASYSPRHQTILFDAGSSMNPRDGAHFLLDLRRGVTTELSTGDLWVAQAMKLGDGRIAVVAVDFGPEGERWSTYLLPGSGRGSPQLWQQGFVEAATDDLRRALVTEPVESQADAVQSYVLDLASGERSRILDVRTAFNLSVVSPDGRWLAYGRSRFGPAYLARFPGGDDERQVSAEGVRSVAFSPDGSKIYYKTVDALYAVELAFDSEVEPGAEPAVELGAPELVGGDFPAGLQVTPQRDADSERFLAIQSSSPNENKPGLVVVQDWASQLEDR